MAIENTELFASESSRSPALRYGPYEDGIKPGTLASIAGAPTLPKLTPLSFDPVVGFWKVWSAGIQGSVSEQQSIDLKDPTAGTYTLTFDGQVTTALAFNANNAAVLAALEALSNIAPGDVVLSGGPGNTDPIVVTFAATYAGANVPVIAVGFGSLTGQTANPEVTVTREGAGADGTADIEGFLVEDDFVASATAEKIVNILRRGIVHYADIPVPAGENSVDLKAALRSGPREKGLVIDGLSGVH